jgi:hypothetical protein
MRLRLATLATAAAIALVVGACDSTAPSASPTVTCGDIASSDCQAAGEAALEAVAGKGAATRVELGRGAYCATSGLLFEDTTCPGGAGLGVDAVGHALVTFQGTDAQAYLNIVQSGSTLSGSLIAIATPPPVSS